MFSESEVTNVPASQTEKRVAEPRSGPELELSQHCIDRHHERVRPSLCRRGAENELKRMLLAHGRFTEVRPDVKWLRREADAWITIGSDIALPLAKCGCVYVALTTLCAGHCSKEYLNGKRARQRNRKARSRQGGRR